MNWISLIINLLKLKTIIATWISYKISFLLTEYALSKKIDKRSKSRLERLASIRNRLIHYGKFPKEKYDKDALLIIFITEYITTVILGLRPTNVYGTISKLEVFLKGKEKPNQ